MRNDWDNRMMWLRGTIFLLLGFLPMSSQGQSAILKMPKDQDVVFENYGVTETQYFQFRMNGTYRQLFKGHFAVDEMDRGTWSQNSAGEITLVSSNCVHTLVCGPLEVHVFFSEQIDQLHQLRADIVRFLESHKAEKFTFEEIQTIPISKDTPSIWPKDIRRPTVRQYVASLVPAIDRFLKDPKKNHLHGTPTTYKGTTFLSWKDGESYFSSEFIQRQIDARLKDHYALTHIYKRIDRETFERDSRKTQEFIFYPEMNKLIRQPQEKK